MQALIVVMSEVRLEQVAWGHFPAKYHFQYLLFWNHHMHMHIMFLELDKLIVEQKTRKLDMYRYRYHFLLNSSEPVTCKDRW